MSNDADDKAYLIKLWGEDLTNRFISKLEKLNIDDKFLNSFNHSLNADVDLKSLELMTISAYLALGIYGDPLKYHLIVCRRLVIDEVDLKCKFNAKN